MNTKRILIPTDFTISSLNVLKMVLSSNENGHQYEVILLHGVYASDSITDLLFFSKHKLLRSVSNPDFEDAVMIIKNKYNSTIRNIRKDIFSGYTQAAFNNYIEANKIDEAFVSANYIPTRTSKNSFDVSPFISKSSLKVNGVEWSIQQEQPEKGQVAEILLNSVSTS